MTTLATEDWTGTDGAAWPAEWSIGYPGVQTNKVAPTIMGNKGYQVTGTGTGYGYSQVMADRNVPGLGTRWDISVDVTLTAGTAAQNEDDWLVAVVVNSDGTNLNGTYYPDPDYGIEVWFGWDMSTHLPYLQNSPRYAGNTVDFDQFIYLPADFYAPGNTYTIRTRRIGPTMDSWVWLKGTTPPEAPMLTRIDTNSYDGTHIGLKTDTGTNDLQYTGLWDNLVLDTAPLGYFQGQPFTEAYYNGVSVQPRFNG